VTVHHIGDFAPTTLQQCKQSVTPTEHQCLSNDRNCSASMSSPSPIITVTSELQSTASHNSTTKNHHSTLKPTDNLPTATSADTSNCRIKHHDNNQVFANPNIKNTNTDLHHSHEILLHAEISSRALTYHKFWCSLSALLMPDSIWNHCICSRHQPHQQATPLYIRKCSGPKSAAMTQSKQFLNATSHDA